MDKHKKYNQSDLGKQRTKTYREKTATKQYLEKPFIAIGSISLKLDDNQLIYIHLQLSTGPAITNTAGLTTNQILNFITSNTGTSKENTLVSYNATYDWNQWLNAADYDTLKNLYSSSYRSKATTLGLYKIKINRGQSFIITDLWQETRVINEVYGFFSQPLNLVLEQNLKIIIPGGTQHNRAIENLEQLKQQKKTLALELNGIVQLMTELRNKLNKVGLRPRKWSGAGSITSNLFQQNKIKDYMTKHPADIDQYARIAYAGGRFEALKYGSINNHKSYGYDINSAYPEAMTHLPNLAGGRWHSIAGDPGYAEYALYKITTQGTKGHLPAPLFSRDNLGTIHYPISVTGWYWTPEIEAVRLWAKRGLGKYEIDQALIFEPANNLKPFSFLADLYSERMKLKAAGDEAEQAIKLALNTASGKLAQQIGYLPADETNPETIPPYFQLDWAGYLTSYTRAKMFTAALENPAAVIAFETDCIYTAEPLKEIKLGTDLGEYKTTIYNELTYINSGIYYGTKENGDTIYKLRGLTAGSVEVQEIIDTLELPEHAREINIKQQRFVSALQVIEHQNLDQWLVWQTETIKFRTRPQGKRTHLFCSCPGEGPLIKNFWHTTTPTKGYKKMVEYCVEWINPDPIQLEQRKKQRLDNDTLQ